MPDHWIVSAPDHDLVGKPRWAQIDFELGHRPVMGRPVQFTLETGCEPATKSRPRTSHEVSARACEKRDRQPIAAMPTRIQADRRSWTRRRRERSAVLLFRGTPSKHETHRATRSWFPPSRSRRAAADPESSMHPPTAPGRGLTAAVRSMSSAGIERDEQPRRRYRERRCDNLEPPAPARRSAPGPGRARFPAASDFEGRARAAIPSSS